jgi:hypothetical protein
MAQTKPFATYTDVDGTIKRYVDIDEQTTSEIDHVGHTVIGMISGRSWPIKERALKAAMTTMTREEIGIVASFIHDLEGSFRYYDEIETRYKRCLDR